MDKDYKFGDSSLLQEGIAGGFGFMVKKVSSMNKALEDGYERSAKIAEEIEAFEVYNDVNST